MMEKATINLHPIDPMCVPLYVLEQDNEISVFNAACAFCSQHGYHSWRNNTHALYYLRGSETQTNVLAAILEVPALPEALREVIDYLQFYNQLANAEFKTVKINKETFPQYVIQSMAEDCRKIAAKSDCYIAGRGEGHVWISERVGGKRLLLIHF